MAADKKSCEVWRQDFEARSNLVTARHNRKLLEAEQMNCFGGFDQH